MKKKYVKPSFKVYEIQQNLILCGSSTPPNNWPYPGAHIPGQPADEKHLA